jgi:hypothetical protein
MVAPNSSAFFLSLVYLRARTGKLRSRRQRWYPAQGTFAPGLRTIPVQIFETTVGSSDTSTPPGQETVQVGTLAR